MLSFKKISNCIDRQSLIRFSNLLKNCKADNVKDFSVPSLDNQSVEKIRKSYMYEKLFDNGFDGYRKLLDSGMFFELFPELSGDYVVDIQRVRHEGYNV